MSTDAGSGPSSYTLVFAGRDIGTVDEYDFNFPTFSGRYQLLPENDGMPVWQRLLDYEAFSVQRWPLFMEERIDDVAWDEEEQFVDLIESEEWCLRDAAGQATPILIPMFGPEGQINWRLNASRRIASDQSSEP